LTLSSQISVGDSVSEISWLNATGGAFNVAADWLGGVPPSATDDAVLGPLSSPYTVTSSVDEDVNSIQLDPSATLSITSGDFTATMGTGTGANAGEISVGPTTSLTAGGDIDNSGLIQLNQATPAGGDIINSWPVAIDPTQGASLVVASGGLSLSGGGEVYLENPIDFTDTTIPAPPGLTLDTITGQAGAVFTNVDNTIYGAGDIGKGPLKFVNESPGVVDASLSTPFQLYGVGGGVTNDGLLENTGTGGLYIVYSTVDQVGGGEISANGGIVYFSYADVIGGSLLSSGNGRFYWDHGNTTLDGTQSNGLAVDALVFISDGATLTLEGAITNAGQIGVGTGAEASELIVGADGVTLGGGGDVILQGSDPNTGIVGAGAGSTLTNVDNTISGEGVIGGDGLAIVNSASGVIDASSHDTLTLQAAVTNTGLLEATAKGGLQIAADIENAGGGILAVTGSTVTLSGADIQGGALTTSGSGMINVTGAGATLDGTASPITVDGNLAVYAGAALSGLGSIDVAGKVTLYGSATLQGPLENTGTIAVEGGALTVQGAVTGTGLAIIDGGSLTLGSTFAGSVEFAGSGELSLADSQSFDGQVIGFSSNGNASLDLGDVRFVSSGEATFSGGSTGGDLTITDGMDVAQIYLVGDYLGDTFAAQSDGAGGTIVTMSQTTFTLTKGTDTISGGPAANTVIATAGTLNPGDEINGGSGASNTLEIQGGGNFNLGIPAELTGFATIDASEGQLASGAIASTYQSLVLRSSLDATIDVASASAVGGNPNPVEIAITGAANDSSTINLGNGVDTVRLGSSSETVNGGSGADTVTATAATAGALIQDTAGGALTMDVTGGGAINLNAEDSGISVVLKPSSTAYDVSVGAEDGLLIDDLSSAADTLSAGGAGQTFTGGAAGELTLIASNQGGDVFEDTANLLNGDTINNFAAAARNEIDITNLNFSRLMATFTENASGTAGQLNLTDGTHTASIILFGQFAAADYSGSAAGAGFVTAFDGKRGTDVTWASLVTNSASILKS
jgi:hypothetical protein